MEPTSAPARESLVSRHFSDGKTDPLDQIEWVTRDAWSPDSPYYQADVSTPKDWSQQSLDITSKLYLNKTNDENIRGLIERVVDKITEEGSKSGYFGNNTFEEQDEESFNHELKYLLVNQMVAFNSPVFFNIGRDDRPQCPSACFLLGVQDTSESILEWGRREAFIFKNGAGSGANLSHLRASVEPLSTGGTSSGPVSFMRPANAIGETFKSGGTTRRCAKLVCLDDDHPDILDFIECKRREEKRLHLLREAGINISMDVEGERNVAELTGYQSANNSIRLSDGFMARASGEIDDSWDLIARKTGEVTETVKASDLLDKIAKAAWECADPGAQFHHTINKWHTTPNDGPIRTSNPCGETNQPDDSSCNLASINILKFIRSDGNFAIDDFRHAVDILITAMDILVEFCELPDEILTRRTKEFRWLGLGYANMGAAIMAKGLAYDSDAGRDFAASVSALETGRAYRQSSKLAERLGAFDGFEDNREPMLNIIRKHQKAMEFTSGLIWAEAKYDWSDALQGGELDGYRNAQATVIAPTGTTSFFMGCDTTGIEPGFNLVTDKQLAGGGTMKLVNGAVHQALKSLGHTDVSADMIVSELKDLGRLPETMISKDHLPVFASAGEISPEGHVKMVATVQPFISGAASKTINLSKDASWQDIRNLYILAWKLGVKGISVYRDGSKARQVLSSKPKETLPDVTDIVDSLVHGKSTVFETTKKIQANSGPHQSKLPVDEIEQMSPEVWKENQQYQGGPRPPGVHADEIDLMKKDVISGLPRAETPYAEDAMEGVVGPERRRMPRDADMLRHKFNVGGHEGYLLVGLYPDGKPGEIFLEDIGKEGSHLRGMTNSWAISVSISLQFGTPLDVLVRKYTNMNFEPHGKTECAEIPIARSIPDYVMKWLALTFLPEMHDELGLMTVDAKKRQTAELDIREAISDSLTIDDNGKTIIDQSALSDRVANYLADVSANTNGYHSVVSDQICPDCGSIMQRAGSCHSCPTCGATTGCG